MTIQKRVFVFLVLSCFLFATIFSVSGCGGLASLVTAAASTSLGGMEAWVFVPAAGARNILKNSPKVSPPAGFIALPGATLTIVGTGQSAVTDSSGYASITGLANGTYTVTVSKEGYKTFSYTVTVATGVDTQVGGNSGIETEVSTAPGIMNLSATSGAIGSSVTITGVNFGSTQGTSTVKFNGTTATSVTSWSSTQIVCVIPSGATTGNVIVTVGSESSNSISFTVSGSALSWHTVSKPTSETINGVWGTSDGSTVIGACTDYKIVRYTAASGTWSQITIDGMSGGAFKDVWGTSDGTKVYAVGDNGNIRCSTDGGSTWVDSESGVTGVTLNGIWGSSSSQVFAVGNAVDGAATLRYYDGAFWDHRVSLATKNLLGIWGSGSNNIYAVGAGGTIVKYTGAWNPVISGTEYNLLGVWGSGSNNIFVVCQNDGVIGNYNGKSWSWNQAVSGVTVQLNGVWGSSGSDVFVVGNTGTILHYDGSTWSSMTSGTTENLNGVWGSSSSDVYAVGASGKILHYGTE